MMNPNCFHCGNDCDAGVVLFDEKHFCCNGCKVVFEILSENALDNYYNLTDSPGKKPSGSNTKFTYLDNDKIVEKLYDFKDDETGVINLFIPHIHCSSCIWVLENLHKLHSSVYSSQVNFPKKEVRISFQNKKISLREVVELLSSIGYEPYISLKDELKHREKIDRSLLYKIGVAGFAFGNIMLLSFPEYFQSDEYWLNKYKWLFRLLIFITVLPVVFYAANDYFISAYKGLRKSILNIDVPIVLGILVLFLKSTYEIFFNDGQGYFDSLAGFVFFLLLGRIFQQQTYSFLSFERDFKSYFPLAVTRINKDGVEDSVAVQEININDRILIRNQELIPVDGVLINGDGLIDYSFVTGESIPVAKRSGDKLFAGGKQFAGAIELEVLKNMSQSYLSQLWSNDVFNKDKESEIKNLTNSISKQFTLIVLFIALVAGVFWYFKNPDLMATVVTSVLIVACPCALALSAPFALGNMLRIFGRDKIYLKNADVIERLANVDTIIFDKTGTITTQETKVSYEGNEISQERKKGIKSLVRASNHPLSRLLYNHLQFTETGEIKEFEEEIGKGIKGIYNGQKIKVGSAKFLGLKGHKALQTHLFIEIEGELMGKFGFEHIYRPHLKHIFNSLSKNFHLGILSGDNEGEKETLAKILPKNTSYQFDQKPQDKLEYIKDLQKSGKKVLMIGDGLNDAGALAQSEVGLVISENVNVFSPASDGIIDAKKFKSLDRLLINSKKTLRIIKMSFVFSLLYNLIGMGFALTGNLSPIVSAILMPLSSISIVIFVTIATYLASKRKH